MQLSPAKTVAFALVGLVGLALAYAWADVVMRHQIHDFRASIASIGYARGGRPPTDDEVREQVEALAVAHRVAMSELEVSSEEASGIGSLPSSVDEIAAAFGGRHRVYRVRAHVRVKKWDFSRDVFIEEQFALRTLVELVPARAHDAPIRELGESTGTRGLGTH